jgi:hypothetical protein
MLYLNLFNLNLFNIVYRFSSAFLPFAANIANNQSKNLMQSTMTLMTTMHPASFLFPQMICATLLYIGSIGSNSAVVAQQKSPEQDMKTIRAMFKDVNERIAQKKLYLNQLLVNARKLAYPVVGASSGTADFYFELLQAPTEKSNPKERLRKVSLTSERGAIKWWSEYLFDESGALVFVFVKQDWGDNASEQRLYYNNGAVVAVLEGAGAEQSPMHTTGAYSGLAAELMTNARSLQTLFTASMNIPSLFRHEK